MRKSTISGSEKEKEEKIHREELQLPNHPTKEEENTFHKEEEISLWI